MEKGKYLLRYFQEKGMCGLTHPAASPTQPQPASGWSVWRQRPRVVVGAAGGRHGC
jgi:hypothetical protein